MEHPVVLVISKGSETLSTDVVSNIRKLSNDKDIHTYNNEIFYIHEIKTKYYNTKIMLHITDDPETIAQPVKESIEGILVYFDANDRSFLDLLPKYVDFIESQEIEFCMMLCNELHDDANAGITFKCIKDYSSKLDIIEIEKASGDSDEENLPQISPSGYAELAQALQSHMWSNVDVNNVLFNATNNGTSTNGSHIENEDVPTDDIENELENFEKLLSQMMQFRPDTSSMSRDDRLNFAQGFAEVFEKLILQDEDINNLSNED